MDDDGTIKAVDMAILLEGKVSWYSGDDTAMAAKAIELAGTTDLVIYRNLNGRTYSWINGKFV